MRRAKFFAKGVWVDRHLAEWITIIMIMYHVGLGVAIVSGGIERFSIPSYNPLIDFTHGQVWLWGACISISAILMSVPFRWPNIIGLWVGMVWHLVWMASFTIAVIRYETAAVTPIPAYAASALICAALLTARAIDKTKE